MIQRLVKNRAIEPDDMLDVGLDFGDVIALKNARLVRPEVAVCDRVSAIVPGTWLVDVLRRQR